MIQKDINNRYVAIASKVMLYAGVVILIAGLIYMIANVAKADLIVRGWIPFMVVGVFIVFFSQLIKRISRRKILDTHILPSRREME